MIVGSGRRACARRVGGRRLRRHVPASRRQGSDGLRFVADLEQGQEQAASPPSDVDGVVGLGNTNTVIASVPISAMRFPQ